MKKKKKRKQDFIPALRFKWLTDIFDPFIQWTMPEKRMRSTLKIALSPRENDKVLDFGCGTGTMLVLLKEQFPPIQAEGIDIDVKVLAIAEEKAPSDMMDGRIGALRRALDANHKSRVAIMSYSVKYASNLYGPFRDAAHSAPSFGDRKTYQMDYHNRRDALVEADLDTEEGADMLMVKPASFYLDIISAIKQGSHLPIVAYQVSGEYTMLYNAVKDGVVNEQAIYEQLIAIKRAGADMIISYFSKYIAKQLEG